MITLLGLGLGVPSAPKAEVAAPVTSISIIEFSRDRSLFDSGAAFGRAQASVPVSGTGTAGETVQVRLLPTGGSATPWEDFAVIDGAGGMVGDLVADLSPHWARVEARIKSEPVTRATTTNRFGVGHVIALWGQSEIVRIRSTAYNVLPPEPLLAEDAVQAMWFDGTPVLKHLTDGRPAHRRRWPLWQMCSWPNAPAIKSRWCFKLFPALGSVRWSMMPTRRATGLTMRRCTRLRPRTGSMWGCQACRGSLLPARLRSITRKACSRSSREKTADGTAVTFPTTITYGASGSYQADHWFGGALRPRAHQMGGLRAA